MSKPIKVNLAFPLNIIGSGSGPLLVLMLFLFAVSLKALHYSFSDEGKRAGWLLDRLRSARHWCVPWRDCLQVKQTLLLREAASKVWEERSTGVSLPSAVRKAMLTETAVLTTEMLCYGLQYWSMFSRSPSHKGGFALGGTVQTQEAVPGPKTLQCRCKMRDDSRWTWRQGSRRTQWQCGSGSIAQQFSQHLIGTAVEESLKEGFEDNRILHRYFWKAPPKREGQCRRKCMCSYLTI